MIIRGQKNLVQRRHLQINHAKSNIKRNTDATPMGAGIWGSRCGLDILQRRPDHNDRLNGNRRLTKRDALATYATDYFTPSPLRADVARGFHE
jgi:hypothetical protein